jgi:F-box and WD-40 domain protein CDC4
VHVHKLTPTGANNFKVLDFGAARDGVPLSERGRRIVVNNRGHEIEDIPDADMVDAANQT